jgi:hypothetical protein
MRSRIRAIAAERYTDKEEFFFTKFERTELDVVLCALGKTFEGTGSSNIYTYGGELISFLVYIAFLNLDHLLGGGHCKLFTPLSKKRRTFS